jgi:transcriptional regulator with XRE-family HTH domain
MSELYQTVSPLSIPRCITPVYYNAEYMATLGQRIREARGDRSPTEIAVKVGVRENTLYRWERDERKPMGLTLAKLAAVLGIDSDVLAGTRPAKSRSIETRLADLEEQIDLLAPLVEKHRQMRAKERESDGRRTGKHRRAQ